MTAPGRGDRLAHVLEHSSGLGPQTIRIAVFLCLKADKHGCSSWSLDAIAETLAIPERTVRRSMTALERRDLVRRCGKKGRVIVREIAPNARAGDYLLGSAIPDADVPPDPDTHVRDAGVQGDAHVPHEPDADVRVPSAKGDAGVLRKGTPTSPESNLNQSTPSGGTGTYSEGSADQAALARDVLRTLQNLGLETASEFLASRFVSEFAAGVEAFDGSPAELVRVLAAEAEVQSTKAPLGLLKHWIASRARWAPVLLDARRRQKEAGHAKRKSASSEPVKVQMPAGQLFGEPKATQAAGGGS